MRTLWPADQLGDGLTHLLKREFGLTATNPSPSNTGDQAVGLYLENVAARQNLECHVSPLEYTRSAEQLPIAGPAIIRTAAGDFALLTTSGKLLGPDLATHPRKGLHAAIFAQTEAQVEPKISGLLTKTGLTGSRRTEARRALLKGLLANAPPAVCWQLRQRPGTRPWDLARAAGLPLQLVALLGAYAAQYLALLGAWWLIGQAALSGRVDPAWLVAWALLLLTAVPLRALNTWLQGRIAIRAGGLLKERLLAGALRLYPEETKHQGVGQFFGRVVESDALENLALSGGLTSLVTCIDLLVAAVVTVLGAGGWPHLMLFAAWIGLTLWAAQSYLQAIRRWTAGRLTMTADLIESMVGYRTRLAQEAPARWHIAEDRTLGAYLEHSAALDSQGARLAALLPRGWLIVSVLALATAFVNATGSTPALAISVGAAVLGFRALKRLAAGLRYLAAAYVAWEQVKPLFEAAERPVLAGSPAVSLEGRSREAGAPLLETSDLVFRYPERAEPVLRGCNLRIVHGSRLILEGRSGGGKSTLASLIAGLRAPTSGLLSLAGWDRPTLGAAGWRRLVAFAPQFHENHVLTGTFLYNALLGRPGIVLRKDMAEAEEVCRELGLGPLLERMPAGLMQLVGETGWQLSHGERSRLFIARTLLQGADLVVLDESFAALDPETLRLALDCVHRRAGAVLTIAHE
jgi:ATP-binding cassette, subfamily B, bacterial